MDKIKLIIRDELKKESNNYLIESLKPLSTIRDNDVLVENFMKTAIKLVDEGYTLREIELIVEQNSSWWGNLLDPETGKFNWGGLFGGATKSTIMEQILKWLFVKILGMSESVGQSAAIALSEYNPFHLLRLFKGYDACVGEMAGKGNGEGGGLAMTIVEIFINNSQFDGQAQNFLSVGGAAKVGIRNVAAEAVRESDLDDVLAKKICGYIWKAQAAKADSKVQPKPEESGGQGNSAPETPTV